MNADDHLERATRAIVSRTKERYARYRQRTLASTDRLFAALFVGPWLFAIFIALVLSPYGWEGKSRAVHMHVWIAIVLGGAIATCRRHLREWLAAAEEGGMIEAMAEAEWRATSVLSREDEEQAKTG